jgi:hypothetical protein
MPLNRLNQFKLTLVIPGLLVTLNFQNNLVFQLIANTVPSTNDSDAGVARRGLGLVKIDLLDLFIDVVDLLPFIFVNLLSNRG